MFVLCLDSERCVLLQTTFAFPISNLCFIWFETNLSETYKLNHSFFNAYSLFGTLFKKS